MVKEESLVLLGNSVFLAGLRAELERRTSLHMVTIDAADPLAIGQVGASHPLAVLFDLAASSRDLALALLHAIPGLLLIGVDPSGDHALVLESQERPLQSIEGLIQMITEAGAAV